MQIFMSPLALVTHSQSQKLGDKDVLIWQIGIHGKVKVEIRNPRKIPMISAPISRAFMPELYG